MQIDGARRERSASEVIRSGSNRLTMSRGSANAQRIRDDMRSAVVIESDGAKVIRDQRDVTVREQTPVQSEARARSVKVRFHVHTRGPIGSTRLEIGRKGIVSPQEEEAIGKVQVPAVQGIMAAGAAGPLPESQIGDHG